MLKIMKSRSIIVPKDPVGLAIMCSLERLITTVLSFFQHWKDLRLDRKVHISMKSSCRPMVSILKYTQLVQTMHMLKPESVHLLME